MVLGRTTADHTGGLTRTWPTHWRDLELIAGMARPLHACCGLLGRAWCGLES